MSRHYLLLGLGISLSLGLALPAGAQPPGPPAPAGLDAARLDYGLKPRQIAPDTWVIEGAVDDFSRANGCNIINTGFIVTAQGTLVINTGPSRRYGQQQRAAIERVSAQPVRQVLNLNLHPDYFLGNQAWRDKPLRALAGSIAGQRAEGRAYEDNLFRLCGDWMQGTENLPATEPVEPGVTSLGPLGPHRIELLRLDGHTGDDLVLIDHHSGVVFAGGLVFAERVPTTPHADLARWLASLDALEAKLQGFDLKALVPSHGPVRADRSGIAQTRDWLRWLDATLRDSAERGLDLGEVLRLPLPPRFASWAAQPAEYMRSVTGLYPRYELDALRAATPQPVTAR